MAVFLHVQVFYIFVTEGQEKLVRLKGWQYSAFYKVTSPQNRTKVTDLLRRELVTFREFVLNTL